LRENEKVTGETAVALDETKTCQEEIKQENKNNRANDNMCVP